MGLFGLWIDPNQAVHPAKEKPSAVGTLPIGIVAKLLHGYGRCLVGGLQLIGGVIFDQSFVRAQPNGSARFLQDAMDHGVDLALIVLHRIDLESFLLITGP